MAIENADPLNTPENGGTFLFLRNEIIDLRKSSGTLKGLPFSQELLSTLEAKLPSPAALATPAALLAQSSDTTCNAMALLNGDNTSDAGGSAESSSGAPSPPATSSSQDDQDPLESSPPQKTLAPSRSQTEQEKQSKAGKIEAFKTELAAWEKLPEAIAILTKEIASDLKTITRKSEEIERKDLLPPKKALPRRKEFYGKAITSEDKNDGLLPKISIYSGP